MARVVVELLCAAAVAGPQLHLGARRGRALVHVDAQVAERRAQLARVAVIAEALVCAAMTGMEDELCALLGTGAGHVQAQRLARAAAELEGFECPCTRKGCGDEYSEQQSSGERSQKTLRHGFSGDALRCGGGRAAWDLRVVP